MTKFVKIAHDHVVNTAAVKAVRYYEITNTMFIDLDTAPAGAVQLSRDFVNIPLPDGDEETVSVNCALLTKIGKSRTLRVECDSNPIGCLRIEMTDGDVHLVPAYDEYGGIAQKLLAAFNLDY